MDGMVIIGQRPFKSDFGANKLILIFKIVKVSLSSQLNTSVVLDTPAWKSPGLPLCSTVGVAFFYQRSTAFFFIRGLKIEKLVKLHCVVKHFHSNHRSTVEQMFVKGRVLSYHTTIYNEKNNDDDNDDWYTDNGAMMTLKIMALL